LTGKVKDLVANRIDKTIYIRADGRAKYGDVATVVDEVRNAGVDKVGLETERIERSNAPPPPPPSSD
jgi:biopolymer transport protein ExbD